MHHSSPVSCTKSPRKVKIYALWNNCPKYWRWCSIIIPYILVYNVKIPSISALHACIRPAFCETHFCSSKDSIMICAELKGTTCSILSQWGHQHHKTGSLDMRPGFRISRWDHLSWWYGMRPRVLSVLKNHSSWPAVSSRSTVASSHWPAVILLESFCPLWTCPLACCWPLHSVLWVLVILRGTPMWGKEERFTDFTS